MSQVHIVTVILEDSGSLVDMEAFERVEDADAKLIEFNKTYYHLDYIIEKTTLAVKQPEKVSPTLEEQEQAIDAATGMTRVKFRIHKHLLSQIQDMANEEGCTVDSIINKAIKHYMDYVINE